MCCVRFMWSGIFVMGMGFETLASYPIGLLLWPYDAQLGFPVVVLCHLFDGMPGWGILLL